MYVNLFETCTCELVHEVYNDFLNMCVLHLSTETSTISLSCSCVHVDFTGVCNR